MERWYKEGEVVRDWKGRVGVIIRMYDKKAYGQEIFKVIWQDQTQTTETIRSVWSGEQEDEDERDQQMDQRRRITP